MIEVIVLLWWLLFMSAQWPDPPEVQEYFRKMRAYHRKGRARMRRWRRESGMFSGPFD